MKILIVTQYFPPERGAVRRLFEFAKIFHRNGHEVTVLTAMPNYPDGKLPERYRGRFFVREKLDGLDVARSYVLPAANSQPTKRMVGFITFLISAFCNSFRLRGGYDLVLASSPPVTTAVLGYLVSRVRRSKFVLEIRDLQPESGVQFGNLDETLFTRAIRRVMNYLYRRADQIVCVTEGINEFLNSVGIPSEKLTTIKSGVGDDFIFGHANGIRKKYGWEDKFLVVYSGTLGWVRPLETIIETAKILSDQQEIHFVFVGDGQKREELERLTGRYSLSNVTFTGLQPLENIPYYLRAGDVLVECLKEVEVAKLAVPSKMYEYMASGKPIVIGCPEGEATTLLRQAGGALTFSASDPTRLAELLIELRAGSIDGGGLGKKYHEFIKSNHSRRMWAEKYLDLLQKMQS